MMVTVIDLDLLVMVVVIDLDLLVMVVVIDLLDLQDTVVVIDLLDLLLDLLDLLDNHQMLLQTKVELIQEMMREVALWCPILTNKTFCDESTVILLHCDVAIW